MHYDWFKIAFKLKANMHILLRTSNSDEIKSAQSYMNLLNCAEIGTSMDYLVTCEGSTVLFVFMFVFFFFSYFFVYMIFIQFRFSDTLLCAFAAKETQLWFFLFAVSWPLCLGVYVHCIVNICYRNHPIHRQERFQ